MSRQVTGPNMLLVGHRLDQLLMTYPVLTDRDISVPLLEKLILAVGGCGDLKENIL